MNHEIGTDSTFPSTGMKIIGFNYLFRAILFAIPILLYVDAFSAIGFFLICAVLIIPLLFIKYIMWRFYWGLQIILISSGTILWAFVILAWVSGSLSLDNLFEQYNIDQPDWFSIPSFPRNNLLIILLVTLFALLSYFAVRVWRKQTEGGSTVTNATPLFDFSTPQQPRVNSPRRRNDQLTPVEFQLEVARILVETSPDLDVILRENDMDIEVYREERQVGIVRCRVHRGDAPIAPLFVQEVARIKERLGLSIAYIATTAKVNSDVQQVADQLGIRILDGTMLKRAQRRSVRL